jgi:hypothetical protein
MAVRIVILAALALALGPGHAAPPPAKAEPPAKLATLEELAAELEKVIDFEAEDDSRGTLADLLDKLRIRYKVKAAFDFADKAIRKAYGDNSRNVREEPIGKIEGGRLSLARLLERILFKVNIGGGGLTFLLRRGHIEITTLESAWNELRPPAPKEGEPFVVPPIIYFHRFQGETLEEACEALAEKADATILVDPRCKEKAAGKVKARFVNTPLPAAVELLADAAGLAVIRKANAYYITTVENAAKHPEAKLFRPWPADPDKDAPRDAPE